MSESVVPDGWSLATIDDVATSSGGSTPSKSEPSYWVNGSIPWVSPKDMKSFLVRSSEDAVTDKAMERLTLVPADSVLMVVRSGILARTLPVGINTIPVTVNQDMRAFVPDGTVEARFLAWQLIAKERDILDRCSKHGTTVASIEGPALSSYPLWIAPAAEQSRIVEKLEELLSELDAGVAELKAAQRKLTAFRQSLLKAAVEGTLTAGWRAARANDDAPQETGADLLQRVLAERRASWEQKQLARYAEQGKSPPNGWKTRYPEPLAPDTAALPELPAGWTWASIDQLARVGTGVTPLRTNQAYFQHGDIPWVTSGALNEESVTSAAEHVTALAIAECRLELYPAGSLLVAMYGEGKTRGKCAELAIAATINQAIAAIVLEDCATFARPHVKTFLLNAYEAMRKQASGGVQPNLNLQIIKSLLVPLPAVDEQAEIQRRLEAQLASYRELERAVVHGLQQAAAQRRNILKAAFAGQLVPQDPADESASVLLERIRAARAPQGSTTRKRGRKARENA